MGRAQRTSDQSSGWLSDLIETMDRVASSKAKASPGEVKAFARRLELPALAVVPDPPNCFEIYRLDLRGRPSVHVERRARRRALPTVAAI